MQVTNLKRTQLNALPTFKGKCSLPTLKESTKCNIIEAIKITLPFVWQFRRALGSWRTSLLSLSLGSSTGLEHISDQDQHLYLSCLVSVSLVPNSGLLLLCHKSTCLEATSG